MGLKVVRKRRGWYQRELASRVGCSVSYIRDIENGIRPSYDLALQLAVILDIPTIEIMGVFE